MSAGADQPEEVSAFFDAIASGDRDGVRLLAGLDPSLVHALDQRRFGAVPVTVAAQRGDLAMVDVLLELGADINAKSDWWAGGFAPIHLAGGPEEPDMCDALIERGAVVDVHAAARLGRIERLRELLDVDAALVHARGGDGQLPLHYARDPETAAFLLERGAEIDARDVDHVSTAAQWAIDGRAGVTRFLVGCGAAGDGFMSAAIGDAGAVSAAIADEPAAISRRITRDRFPSPGSEGGHIYLYVIGEGCTMLHGAARYGRLDAMGVLLDAGADPNAGGAYDDSTALHVAAWHDRADAAGLLIERGAEVDRPSGSLHHAPAINWAIIKAGVATVRVLIERGATVGEEQRRMARDGLEGGWRSLTGIEPARYREVAALLGD